MKRGGAAGPIVTNDPNEFYRRFYLQAPSEDQLARLLGEPGVAPR